MNFIMKNRRAYVIADDIRVKRVRKMRATGYVGPFRLLETTDELVPDLVRVSGVAALNQYGHKDTHTLLNVKQTAADVKRVLRRVRPEEAAEIADIDAQIVALSEQISALRERRVQAVHEAWTKAHAVRLKEVNEKIDGAV